MKDAVRTVIVAWVMCLSLCVPLSAFAQSDPGEDEAGRIERLVERHAGNDRIQTERPEWEPETPDIEPRDRNPFIEAIGDFFAWLFSGIAPILKVLLFVAIAAAILYALWYMFGDVVGLKLRRKTQTGDEPEVSDIRGHRPDRGQATALLDQADALAADGRFAEAVHLLLFRSIEDLQERRTGGVPQSLTAREIQSLSDLSARAREALGPIIRIVENSFFGGRAVDRDGWQRARTSYEQFAFGEAGA
ncbi:DUF4129 domain-containing protein [Henriciella aquimarina]|uniref:DUF4129 domain-containing protein n=1 Tax=Henriciella aquimarina TaxID=545261 RepID=UPI000A01EA9B|nr:DUF4129 domain-containing protein [Henriciella aquimarina]